MKREDREREKERNIAWNENKVWLSWIRRRSHGTKEPPPQRAVFVIDWSHRQGNELRLYKESNLVRCLGGKGSSRWLAGWRTAQSFRWEKEKTGPRTAGGGGIRDGSPFVIGKRSRMKSATNKSFDFDSSLQLYDCRAESRTVHTTNRESYRVRLRLC